MAPGRKLARQNARQSDNGVAIIRMYEKVNR